MIRIIDIPIEPLEERYSKQWAKWFSDEYCRLNQNYVRIEGEILTDKITQGSFLDVCGTNYYKASQMQRICKRIYSGEIGYDGDVFLFHDLWFPGIESLAYIRDALGKRFKIAGCLHAGTYDENDFISKQGMGDWGKKLEESWFSFVDLILVATNYHKELILSKREIPSNRKDTIVVTGFPMFLEKEIDMSSIPSFSEKENIIVFPHRLDDEKCPNRFLQIEEFVQNHDNIPFKDYSFIRTKDVCETKQEYYELLKRSKFAVSFALQETWGIAQQEAMFLGCIPVVPDRLSYREMYFDKFRYFNTFRNELPTPLERLKYLSENIFSILPLYEKNYKILWDNCHRAIESMIDEIWRRFA